MNRVGLPQALVPLATAWQGAVRTPLRRAIVAAIVLVVAVALLVARGGTARARLGAAGAIAAAIAAAALVSARERRVWGDPHRAIDRLAGDVDRPRAQRAQRALGLLDEDRAAHEGTSPELAQLHVARALDALPKDAIHAGASRLAFRFAAGSLILSCAVALIAVVVPWSVIEGLDVLVARDGLAPLALTWLDDPELHARPPDYLHELERDGVPFSDVALPHGTLLTYRGVPSRSGRRLALTDGASEVPFVDDGQGHVVARWPVTDTVALRVIARFGDVAIPEGEITQVTSIEDQKPIVHLDDAPRRIELARETDVGEIPIRYDATDDHGLREIHLVLRSGPREERRVLARLDGETRFDKGGHVLRATDSFIKKSHVPVEVRVEAKDNDPITGPKWGASEAITIVPPDVGEPQAARYDALRKMRDHFVDSLAWRMDHAIPTKAGERRAMLAEEIKTIDEDAELLDATVNSTYAGVRVPGRLQALLRGQMRKVREAMNQEARVASPQTHAALVKASEKIVLVIDAVLHGLGDHDVRDASKQLAEVADELALGAAQEGRPDEKERGKVRADAGVTVLEGGGKSMRRLGELGRDIGEIVTADLRRVKRGRDASDAAHAELAAEDLAARLRQPDPSFGERGEGKGGPSRGGGESGGGRGTPGEDEAGEADEVEQAFNEAAQGLENLAQDHQANMAKSEQALAGGASAEDLKSLAEEAKKHAEKVREAVRDLPQLGGGSESWSGKASAAKEHAEQMARGLEEGSPSDALQSGRSAMQALDDAKEAAKNDPWRRYDDKASDAEKAVEAARKKLEPEVAWAEQKAQELRKRAADRAKGELSQSGDEENGLAQRADDLKKKGHDMPAGAVDALDEAEKAMRRAADALHAGDPDRSMDQQREAQRQLEMARQAMGDPGEGSDAQSGEGSGPEMSREATDIPKPTKGPEDFRRRVTEGLSKPSSNKLKDAVRRYAEGLLR